MAEKPLDEAIAELTETIKKLESKQSRSKPGKTFSDVMSGINVESFFPSVFSPIGRAGQGAANLIQGTANQFRGKKLSSAQSELGELQSQQESDPSNDDEDSSSVLSSGDAVSGEGIVQENPVLVQDVNDSEDAADEDMSRWAIVENIEHLVHDSYNCLLDIKKSLENGLKLETKEASNDKIKERDDKRVKAKEKRVETEEKRESSRSGGLMSSMKNMGIASLGAGAEATGGGGMGGMITSVLGSLGMSAILPIVTTIGAAVLAALGAIVSTIGLPVILGILGIGGIIAALFAFKDEISAVFGKISELIKLLYNYFFPNETGSITQYDQFTRDMAGAAGAMLVPGGEFGPFSTTNATERGLGLDSGARTDQLKFEDQRISETAALPQQEQYVELLRQYNRIYRGGFQPDEVIEQFGTEDTPERREAFQRAIRQFNIDTFQEFKTRRGTPLLSTVPNLETLKTKAGVSPEPSKTVTPKNPPRNVTPPSDVGTTRGGQSGTPVASAPNVVNQTTINNIENILRPDTLLRGTAFA